MSALALVDDRPAGWDKLTPTQQHRLDQLDKWPKWLITTKMYFRIMDRMIEKNDIGPRYWQMVAEMTRAADARAGSQIDYRIKLPGQETWIRATPSQYAQAEAAGYPANIREKDGR